MFIWFPGTSVLLELSEKLVDKNVIYKLETGTCGQEEDTGHPGPLRGSGRASILRPLGS